MRLSEAIEQLKYYQSKPYVPTVKKVCNIALETIEALQQENEQLKAQVARVKNAIQYVLYHLRRGGKSWIIDKLEPAISDTPAEYHNPADVEALRKAREALDYWRELYGIGFEVLNWHMNGNTEPFDSFYDNSGTYEALAEIDKAIGGGDVDKG